MKFLFVNLSWPSIVSRKTHKLHITLPPLDLMILRELAGRSGHEGVILDCFVASKEDLEIQLPRLTREADWILVTTTPYCMWQCPNAEWEWIRKAISVFPAEKTVLTGLHGSIFPESTLRETGVRAVIRREPEGAFRDFLQTKDWESCRGVSYLKEEDEHHNEDAPGLSLNEIAIQNYETSIESYAYFLLGKRTGIFEASRGCPWKCSFCDQEMFGWKYRLKDSEVFADEVLRAVERTGMKTAYFFDLEFTIKKKRTLEICDALIKRNLQRKIKWCCQTRADTVDEEVLDALKAAGCTLIHYGAETANPPILEATGKKITLAEIARGITLTKTRGIRTAAFFMFGLPGEIFEDFERTLEFARTLNPTYASFHFAVPFPGTELYTRYLEERGLEPGVWPAVYSSLPLSEIRAFERRAYIKFYLMPKRLELREFRYRMENFWDKLGYFLSANELTR